MHFGVTRHVDGKMITGLVAYKLYEFVGVAIKRGRAHARGRVAAQADEPVDSSLFVLMQEF